MSTQNNTVRILSVFIIFFIIILFISGFLLNENSAGSGIFDYENYYLPEIIRFYNNPFEVLKSPLIVFFPTHTFIHSIIYFLFGESYLRYFNFFCSFLIVYILFLSLKIRFKGEGKLNLLLFSLIILLDPYFRTSSFWAGPDTLAILFLCLGLFFFQKTLCHIENSKQYKDYYIQVSLFLSLSFYFKQIYIIFWFTIILYLILNIRKKIVKIIFLNSFLFLPAVAYFGYHQSLTPTSTITFNPFQISFDNIVIFFSIYLFYFFPILNFSEEKKIKFYILLITSILFIFPFSNFSYDKILAGGMIYKLSNIVFDNNYLLYLTSLVGGYLFLKIIHKNYMYSLIIGLFIIFYFVLAYPYQKYFGIIFLILISNFFIEPKNNFFSKKIYLLVFFYLFIYIGSIFYNLYNFKLLI